MKTKGNKQIKIICDSIIFQKQCGINKGRQMTYKGMSKKTKQTFLNTQKKTMDKFDDNNGK